MEYDKPQKRITYMYMDHIYVYGVCEFAGSDVVIQRYIYLQVRAVPLPFSFMWIA